MTLLVGYNTILGGNPSSAYHYVTQFTASLSGMADKLYVYSTANGNFKPSVYYASGDLLWAKDTDTAAVASTWSSATISPPLAIVAGTVYRLGAFGSTSGVLKNTTSGGDSYVRKSGTYATFAAPAELTEYTLQTPGNVSIYLDGVPDPLITSVNAGNPVHRGQTGVAVVGVGFGASGARAWLMDSATRATATRQIGQVITAQSDTSLTLTIRQEELEIGGAYLHVRSSAGGWSAGFAVDLEEYARLRRVTIYSAALSPAEIKSLYYRARTS